MGAHLSTPRTPRCCHIQLVELGQGRAIRDHAVHKASVHLAFKVTSKPSQEITSSRSSLSLLETVCDGDTLNTGFGRIAPFNERGVTPLRLTPTTPKLSNEIDIFIIVKDGSVQFPNTQPRLGCLWDRKHYGDGTMIQKRTRVDVRRGHPRQPGIRTPYKINKEGRKTSKDGDTARHR